jgi:hypothetical protein
MVGGRGADKVADWLGFHMERWLALAEDGAGFGIGPQPELVARFFSSNGFADALKGAVIGYRLLGIGYRLSVIGHWAAGGDRGIPRRKRRGYGSDGEPAEKPAS